MTYSLRRVLATRFSLTMFLALTLIAFWALVAVERTLSAVLPPDIPSDRGALATANAALLLVLLGTVLLGTIATAFGAYWLARSAVQPVNEMADQARGIPPDVRGGRITAHADVAEYESLVRVINNLLERAEGAFASQRRFIADVSHELRTPLTSLQGQLEVALRAPRTPRDYELVLRAALEDTEHLGRMCDSLLLISRAESGSLTLGRRATDLEELTCLWLERFHRRTEEKGLTVDTTFAYAGDPPLLDPRLLERALGELIDNGIKFSPHGGRLRIGTHAFDQGVVWWIEDNGPGIPPEDLPRLFEPFYRVDPARSRDGGTGLGLTLAASISRLHGGTVRAENVSAGGARFELIFPAAAAQAA